LNGVVFKKEIASIAPKQLAEIAKVLSELTLKRADPQFDFENEGFRAALTILTSTQRIAAARRVHLVLLESDLKVIVRADIARFLELPAQMLLTIRPECEKKQEELDAMRFEAEVEVFRQAYSTLPKDSQRRLKRLYNNVWCELK